ncbi:MAG: imidazole glycerol phosphate synthase subunit HisF [Candidatus Melainabacteria bacterium]|nr:imidazole glycerol phosphate synthase subunit HisF [Candidatus Melainabacteria bacterium]
MLKSRVIPVVLYDGRVVVKSIGFDRHRNVGHPVNVARVYNAREVDELIFLDISATAEGRSPNFELLQDVADECFMPLTIGGGIKSLEDIRLSLLAGADKVCINSAVAVNPSLITSAASKFGSQCIVVGLDVLRSENGRYQIYRYWDRTIAPEDLFDVVRSLVELGAGEIYLNSVDNDGKMEGFDEELIARVCEAVSIPVIAAGGAGKLDDFASAIKCGASAVGAASIFHFTEATPLEVKRHMLKSGIATRL